MFACALLVVLAAKLFDRRVALLSGLFLATSPFFVKWSQQARIYPFLAGACLAATFLLFRALERGSRGAWALYGIAFAAIIVTHAVVAILLAPAHAVLIAQRRERVMPHGLLGAVVVVAVGVPWIAQLALRTADEGSETAWIPFPSPEDATRALLGVSGAGGLGVLLALAGLWFLRRAGSGSLALWLATWAFAPWLVALLVSTVRPIFLDRYLVVAAPAFAMLAAVAVMGVAGRVRRALALAAVLATSVGLVLWYSSDESGNWRGEDWRGAVATVLDRRSQADGVVVVPWWAHDAAEYYGASASDVSSADSIWVLLWSEDGHVLPSDVRRPLGFGEHRRAEKLQFGRRLSAQLWVRP
jgi:mannosyltransferase